MIDTEAPVLYGHSLFRVHLSALSGDLAGTGDSPGDTVGTGASAGEAVGMGASSWDELDTGASLGDVVGTGAPFGVLASIGGPLGDLKDKGVKCCLVFLGILSFPMNGGKQVQVLPVGTHLA